MSRTDPRELLTWVKGERVGQVDADVMLYACCHAAQRVEWSHPDTTIFSPFENKTAFNKWCKENGKDASLATSVVIAEPFHNAKRSFKMMAEKIKKESSADRIILYLSGSRNYRFDVYPEYKANRAAAPKPYHYARLKEYILTLPNTVLVHGMEADDAMGIAQYSNHAMTGSRQWSVVCTIDKDLNMIAGQHYNWNKSDGGLYYQADEDCNRFFYRQLIMGDATDNIKGIPKMGAVAASKAIPDEMTNVDEMYTVVRNMYFNYHNKMEKNLLVSREDVLKDSDADLNLNAQLLWILRHPKTRWEPSVKP